MKILAGDINESAREEEKIVHEFLLRKREREKRERERKVREREISFYEIYM